MRFYRTLSEAADKEKLQGIIKQLEAMLPGLSDAKRKQVEVKIGELKAKLKAAGIETKIGSEFADQGTETKEVSKAARMIAELVHEGVQEGFIKSNTKKILKYLKMLDDEKEFNEASYAYSEFDEDGKEMREVLDGIAFKNFWFYTPYYAELRRMKIAHELPDNPTRLKGQVLSNREWEQNFSEYKINPDTRKYEWKPGSAAAESIEEDASKVLHLEEMYDGNDFFEAYGDMYYNDDDTVDEAEYQGRKVKLGKPMRGDVKKFKVYVRNPNGNIVKVNFGDPNMKIKKSNPARRRSFRARHNCDNPGPRHKARYWSCRKW